ncbi:hypothetical protein EYR36_003530 [Pleurotus pulmonarius]|nr:hypothetical protein EYR36_003530 [Pleurotus pulmonarius]
MSRSRLAAYGTWTSPLSAASVASQSVSMRVEDVLLDPVTSKVYFAQRRSEESMMFLPVSVDAMTREDLFGDGWDARTEVHEWGGAASIVFNNVLYFSNFSDRRVYRCEKGSIPHPITPLNPVRRFADFTVHPKYPHLVVCTTEDYTNPHPAEVVTKLCCIDARAGTVTDIKKGADFYACARFSPDGKHLVWQQWYHPELPWRSSEIAVAPCFIAEDARHLSLGPETIVAGNHGSVAAQDPGWASEDTLFFTCDISGYQNPWKYTFYDSSATGKASPILTEPIEEEFGGLQWWLTGHWSGALNSTTVAFLSFRQARSTLYICDLAKGTYAEVSTPFAHVQYMHGDGHSKVTMLGEPADSDGVLAELVFDENEQPTLRPIAGTIAKPTSGLLPRPSISLPQYYALQLVADNRVCHVTYYPPTNADYESGLPGERPPVVVYIHGGPCYMDNSSLDWPKQFFTSRGWAYLAVNYGGSSGFGRAYRESLDSKWGILDIHDAYHSVLKLDEMGLVDQKRAVVHGDSAGGYSILQMATTLPTAFAAGASQYGFSDMKKFNEVLHKFEYGLCERMMGGRFEDIPEVWRARSPIYNLDKIKMPLLVLMGLKDIVVPVEQMIGMVETIKGTGGKAELILFPDEGHEWRQATTIQTTLGRVLALFSEPVGFQRSS